ncbi:hypothetical protein MRB53_003099 [Persea americana]|uniref:Uncharacterized protein n=1 Tax=Persea americana TaxID=3435 RepID=A0ACC2MXF2_PERAE|nr:hypothetical protein MRB53_003099 [Persea americana]
MVFGVHPVSAPPASRRWPPRDLARLPLLHRSSALNFLHQRQCVAAYRLSRRLPCSKSNPSCRLVSSSIDGSISDWDLFSLKQKRVDLKLEESQKGEVSSHKGYLGEEAVLEKVVVYLKDFASSLKLVRLEAESLLELVLSVLMQALSSSSLRS